MSKDEGARTIHRGTPEMDAFVATVERAMTITPAINRLTVNDAAEIRALFGDLTGREMDDGFRLIPPFYTDCGLGIRVGRRVFINQNCTLYALAGIDIGDNVMIGPNVSIITSGHPVEPSRRYAQLVGKPVAIKDNVWIAAGVTIIGGVTVGENSVIAAGAVVTRDVPPNSLAGGNPAKVIRSLGEDGGENRIQTGDAMTAAQAKLVPELMVTDFARSLAFYVEIIGFSVLYDRPATGFAYLSLNGAEIMIERQTDFWETAKPAYPYGRGMSFQIEVPALAPILARLQAAGIELFRPVEDAWYRAGDKYAGNRQFLVQDPDGFVLRFYEDLGESTTPGSGRVVD